MKPMKPYPVLLSMLLGLSGCGSLLHSDYQRPQLDVPQQWQHQASTSATATNNWWAAFDDQQLARLIEQALERNNDLGKALLSVRRAQLSAGLQQDALWPQWGASASSSNSRQLRNSPASSHDYSVSTQVSWELDLWDRLGKARDAAELEALATEEDYSATELSLVSTVATLYWQLAYLEQRLALSRNSIADSEQTLAIVQARYQAGEASNLELAEARQSLESLRATDAGLRQQLTEQRTALNILYDGQPPEDMQPITALSQATLPEVDAGLPASLLGRRPDLRAAELRLRSSLATVDATRASYYPSFTLTGSLGSASSSLGNVLQNPVAALGSGLVLPFLQWNQMQLNVDIARTDYQSAVIDFRQTLYEALGDVNDSLAARQHYAEQQVSRENALQAANEAERIYRIRYQSGAVDLQSWLQAQETRRSAEITWLENRRDQLLNYVTLCQALGGTPAH